MIKIEEIIIDYYEFIQGYKNLIDIKGIEESSFINKKKGELGLYKYHYHGAGCRLEKEGVICEYDYLPTNDYPIKFSSWKLFEFMETNPKWKAQDYNLDDVHHSLMTLVEKKKLFLLDLNGVMFPIFQIKDVRFLDS
ncbi:DUF6896 domain-containing protein [Sphingobacterium spiritivorum]|uniref:DUF6896 domain-containing protein n=1 Tax=Sphingobacterium spiritivorum TaxID=258 RepID=UPI003DA38E85